MSGDLGAGDKLPSEQRIAVIFDVSRITTKRALDRLAAEGYDCPAASERKLRGFLRGSIRRSFGTDR